MSFFADFTLAQDEVFGDYNCEISQDSKRLIRATVKNFDKTGPYVFLKLFKKRADDEFYLVQRINLTRSEFERLLLKGKAVLKTESPTLKKVTKKFKKTTKVCPLDADEENYDDDDDEGNKENIDPRKNGGGNV